jgi:predicted ATPase
MIIGICGTHGTGKSTILQAAKRGGAVVDESQLSRTAQKALGWDKLSRAEESFDNMWALQDAVLNAMYDRDQQAVKSGRLTVVERTPADAYAYAALWYSRLAEKFPEEAKDLMNDRELLYKAKCRNMANSYKTFVIVPPTAEIPFVEEPNRADAASRTFVELRINEFIMSGNLPCHYMKFISKEQRSAEIQTLICLLHAQLSSKKEVS